MDSKGFSAQCQVKECFQCQGDTEYYCKACKHDLCLQCKEKHVFCLETIYHDVVVFCEKYENLTKQQICVRHPGRTYEKYCYSCELPVCVKCTEHRNKNIPLVCFKCTEQRKHEIWDIGTAYKTNRKHHKEIIHNIRSLTIFNSCFILSGIRNDINTCHKEHNKYQSEMLRKSQRLEILIDSVVWDVKTTHKSLNQRLHYQIRKMKRHLASVEQYEHKSEELENRPIRFILFIKKTRVLKMNTPNLKSPSLLSPTDEINMEDVIKLLTEIEIIERGKRQVKTECLLKLMTTPVFYTTVKLTGVSRVRHISCVTSEQVWITDGILTNIAGDTMYQLTDIASYIWNYGAHTVNGTGEIIYIDRDCNICKLSTDFRTKSTFIKKTEELEPHCVYCSPYNEDLLVVMYNTNTKTAFVYRYNGTGEHIQTIQHTSKGQRMYRLPNYITENRNGDIVVSDYDRAVVVTDRGGRHRFSYTGPPSGSGLRPRGICTDALLNILVCDVNTHTVQMIDKDGYFLSHILTPQHGINRPQGLYYDVKSHLLWVGSWNKVFTCRYIERNHYK